MRFTSRLEIGTLFIHKLKGRGGIFSLRKAQKGDFIAVSGPPFSVFGKRLDLALYNCCVDFGGGL